MQTFTVPAQTDAILIIQEPDVDIVSEPWTTMRENVFNDEHILVDPSQADELPDNSMAKRLARMGYYVFSSIDNKKSKYMLAVKQDNMEINHA